ncbi:redoxin domain-containing protein [Intrasporangium sp.]|uniref:TlpA family protein disulfide reductase n=1 Tax=Intrasporangium sp. TaxID=1925024 RepID=UPI0032217954
MSDRTLPGAPGTGTPPDELFDEDYLLDAPPPRAPRPAPPRTRSGGIDALAEPSARGTGAGPAPDVRPGLRERIRASRYGTIVVLLVTAALVAGGTWVVDAMRSAGTTAAAGTAAVSLPGRSTAPPPKVGAPAQDFTLTAIDGTRVSLAELAGRPVWVVFGASWCAACQAEVPDIEAAYRQHRSQGLAVIGVNISEGEQAVRDYAQRVGITFPIGADTGSAVADTYRVSAIPAHFFIDADGVLRERREGAVSPETITTSLRGVMTP